VTAPASWVRAPERGLAVRARLLTYWSASGLDRGERSDLQTGMAKLFASEVALQVAQDSMRVHGGYGYSAEFKTERLYRDSILMTIGEGTSDIMRTVIARSLVAGQGKVGW
jgi:alkylation response protein AidB-like acyl-CoA dehydrogenase